MQGSWFTSAVQVVMVMLAVLGVWSLITRTAEWVKRRQAETSDKLRIGPLDLLEELVSIRNLLNARLTGPDPEMVRAAQALGEHVHNLDASCLALTLAVKEALPGLGDIGKSAYLVAGAAKSISDQVVILRSVVFGQRRAEEFAGTDDDPEAIRRANMAWETESLVRDHGLSRPEAERRVRDMFSRVPR